MKTERELFEEFAYSKKWNITRVCDMGLDHYVNDFVDGAWIGWQASVNRDGFVLVPVEPTEKIDAIIDLCNNSRGSIHWEVDSFIEGIEEILK